MICRTTAKEKKPSYGGKQYSLQGAGGTASGAAEYTNAYRSSDSILVVHCSSFRERPPGAALSSHRKCNIKLYRMTADCTGFIHIKCWRCREMLWLNLSIRAK